MEVESEVAMVAGRIVEGSPKEIAEQITQIAGERRVSVLLINDSPSDSASANRPSDDEIEKALADIRALAVRVGHVDDSREAIYTRQEGE
jgi:hypothetical protein